MTIKSRKRRNYEVFGARVIMMRVEAYKISP